MFRKNEYNVISTDFYIRDDGHAEIRAITNQAAIFLYDLGLDNILNGKGPKYCGQPVWTPGMDDGVYHAIIDTVNVFNFITACNQAKLTVESEF